MLGWKPYEYYTSSPYEFFCASEGFLDKMEIEARNHRNTAGIIYASMGGKEKIEKIWPLWGDKKPSADNFVMTPEMYEAIKKAHGLN